MDIYDKIHNRTAVLEDQEEALKDPWCAYIFANDVEGADIEKCQEAACRDLYWAYRFAKDIPEANIKMGLKACRGTVYEDMLNKYLMDKALR